MNRPINCRSSTPANLGLAHDLDTLTAAIKVLDGSGRFRFHFVGGGGRRDELAAFVQREGITSIEMLPYVKRNELSSSLSWGDIGLVTQRDQCCGSIVPSKVYGLMAAGRPILFIGPAAATPACIIRRFKCGWHVACGDVDKLTQLLMHLSDHRDEVLQAGIQGRQALLENFDLHLGTSRIASLLLRDLSSGPATDPSWCVENTKGERALISNS
ncbi:MAG: glycosyltransferase [Edaphobacter sp.]|uniref:glycosyltransferase n=1 Tax=Edaphobacter sp. TaxID=1934404 RepID=UPI002386A2E8|nr:glycosyltransferase [Edaphobacter sp.]MDE1175576.1 glycosyltransferase [Edaphobacter sp.]